MTKYAITSTKVYTILSIATSWIQFLSKKARINFTRQSPTKKKNQLRTYHPQPSSVWLVMELTSLPVTFPLLWCKSETGFVFQAWEPIRLEARVTSMECDAPRLSSPGRLFSINAKNWLKPHLQISPRRPSNDHPFIWIL